ncbi:MAG: adenosylcobalamin-dependent ribonucleoside-diphosphate reductase [Bacteroidales bacterium]|jgi:ribonucleoside-diphosphate reductase alpha chain|nr:adenosylcobalamin-dependent ribonucleoside-diphosphate reductase [Bacteroidales bacterium]
MGSDSLLFNLDDNITIQKNDSKNESEKETYLQKLENTREVPSLVQKNNENKPSETTGIKSENKNNRVKYSIEEAKKEATKYFKGDDLAADVWVKKYALKDSNGNIYEKSPDEMHRRIASEIARIERNYTNPLNEDLIYELLRDFKYVIPAGSPMAGIGNDMQISSLSNCFVIGTEGGSDSYGAILKIDQEQVQLMKRRGGVGHDLSHIRPTGSHVNNTALTSTGVVPFMERYSNSTREVAQDGRRGALMLSISIKHPDAEKFIDAKLAQGKITGANISVKIDDEFMNCVREGKEYIQRFPIDSENPMFTKSINATELWNKIIHNAWASAEPGVLFWDTIKNESVPDCYKDYGFETVSTNPCGEIPLCPYDSCRLIALNLYSYVENPFTDKAYFNTEKFKKHVHLTQRIMDDIVDLEIEKVNTILKKIENDPESEETKRVEQNLWLKIKDKSVKGRRMGIGITAEGDMLAAMGYRYGSDLGIEFATEIQKLVACESYRASVDLAEERGAFPIFNYQLEKKNPLINRIEKEYPEIIDKMAKVGRRNIALLTIAPTGSVSICTQTTSGIEPAFMIYYKRRKKVNPNDKAERIDFVDNAGDSFQEFNVFHHNFITWLKVNNYDVDEVMNYSADELDKLIEKSPYHLATSKDIDWVAKVKMQGAMQKWVDHSISVTVNIPNDVTEDVVSTIYQTAWESGCKGMTIYRDGSREGVLVSHDTKMEETAFKETKAPPRPQRLEADVVRFQNNYEQWIAVVGLLDGKPYEIFTGKAEDFWIHPKISKGWVVKNKDLKNGVSRYDFEFLDQDGFDGHISGLSRSFDKQYWNYAKLISGILRHGMPLPSAIKLIQNMHFEEDHINTWKNGVARALKRYIPDGMSAGRTCPECKSPNFVLVEGCEVCKDCGHSKCGG